MPLSWIKRPKQPVSVDELVAAEQYGKAIDLMRTQFSQRYPSTTERQRYAEVLVLAGRGAEAVPVLLGIADEQERYGFPDEAIETLQQASEIDPDQAEVKERLESIRKAPTEAPPVDPPAPVAEVPGAADSWGSALDGTLGTPGEPLESQVGAAEAPREIEGRAAADASRDEELEFAVLDAEDPAPLGPEGERGPADEEGRAAGVVEPAPPENEKELVVVEDADEITATSIRAQPGVPGAEEAGPPAADEGEITARSIQVDPSVLGERQPGAADDGEITATSIQVDPSVLGEGQPGTATDDGEITATSIQVDPGVLGEKQSGTAEDEGEITARSIQVDPAVLDAKGLEPVAEDGEITPTGITVEPSVRGAGEPGPSEPGDELEHAALDDDELELAAGDTEALEPASPSDGPDTGEQHLLLPEDDLDPEEVAELTAEDSQELDAEPVVTDLGVEADARALLSGSGVRSHEAPPFHTGEDPETGTGTDAGAPLLPENPPEADDELRSLLTDEDLEAALTADAQALIAGAPTEDEPGPPEDDGHLDELLTTDARALLSDHPKSDDQGALDDDRRLDELLATDARALLSDGPTRDAHTPPVDAPGDSGVEPVAEAPDPSGERSASDETGAPPADGKLDELLAADVRALFSASPASSKPAAPGDPAEEAAADTPAEDHASDGPEPAGAGEARAAEAPALPPEGPVNDEPTDAGPDEELAADAHNLLSGGHPDETHLFLSEDDLFGALTNEPEPSSGEIGGEDELAGLVLALAETGAPDAPSLGSVLFADLPREELRGVAEGLSRRTYSPGDTVVREGEPGRSLFLIASGSVRILVMAGHGQPFEIRRIDAGDFFGEVAALSDKPRSATAVAATPCEMLEIDRGALEALVARRPAGRPLLDDAWVKRALSPEETAVRSLPPEAADPRQAAAALRARYGSCDWSARVRLHLSGLLLEEGRADDALATLAGVAEDLAQQGHGKKAIAILKKAGPLRHRGSGETAEDAAFRDQVEALLRETVELAARPAPPVQEVAEGAGEEQGNQLAG